jgi:hypothetical protein
MEDSMNPVNTKICQKQEEYRTKNQVSVTPPIARSPRSFSKVTIKLRVASNLSEKPRECENIKWSKHFE